MKRKPRPLLSRGGTPPAPRRGRRGSKAAAATRIDLDPAVTAGFIHDRYDLLVRGCVRSCVPVAEVIIELHGEVVGILQHGQLDETPRSDLNDGVINHIFHTNLPLRRTDAHGVHVCNVAARTRNGEHCQQSFELALDPHGPSPVTITSGPTVSPRDYAHLRAPLVLYVERAALDASGQLLVHGWSISSTSVVTVQVFVGEDLIGVARLGGQRLDVETVFPAYPNARTSGFTFSKRLRAPVEGVASVRVQAINLQGFSHETVVPVQCPAVLLEPQQTETIVPIVTPTVMARQPSSSPTPINDPTRQIRFFCDNIELDAEGHLRVIGWALCPVGLASITVHLGDQELGLADLGLPRADVAEEYRHVPMAQHSGFRFIASLGALEITERRIRLVLRNSRDDVREEVRTIPAIDTTLSAQSGSAPTRFRLEVDTPSIVAGNAVDPVVGQLTIEGWALARSGVAKIDVLLDEQRVGEVHYGLARQDVAAAFPDWADSLRCGFAFHCPPRGLRNGRHVVQLRVHATNGETFDHRFNIQVSEPDNLDDNSLIRRRMTQAEADVLHDVLNSLGQRTEFRLIVRHNAEDESNHLLATLASLQSQVYDAWRVTIVATDGDTASATRILLAEAADELADKVEVVEPSHPLFDQPLADDSDHSPSLFGVLTAGDRFGCDALLQMAVASALYRDADFLYADESRISPASHVREPFFKPDFSPDLLLSTNYIGRPWFASGKLLNRSRMTLRDLANYSEYDAVLRCTERAARIHHVPKLLCDRGTEQIDDTRLEASALQRAATRRGIAAKVSAGAAPGTWRFRRTHKVSGLVSIIIPTCGARGLIETCIKSLRKRTAYRNFEIICVDNIPNSARGQKAWLRRNADRVVPMPEAFNWSHFNNRGADAASGEYLLFLNDDIEVTQPDWLGAMLEHMQRPEVAIVGPQLLFPDHKVQHAGMFLGLQGVARHAFRFTAADEPGYFGLALTQRNVIAVTGACMLMRRSLYKALGGFEEAHEIINNDLDFCLRAHQAGKLIVYTPYASLVHHEAASRDGLEDLFDLRHFDERWRTLFAAGDPYFNPNLSRNADDYRRGDEVTEAIFADRPLFRHADIKRILVVKLDHIGDFVTAIPAMRRLKQIFPAASIHVLTGRAARSFHGLEDCIDEFIEFEYFHAISRHGTKDVSTEEYEVLRQRLAPYRFDIAVDLRKHPDTRNVLRYTPARFLAGYDHMGQFPFLDISLEWDSDRNLTRKRSHVTNDLINLVEAIGTAGTVDSEQMPRFLPQPPPDFLSDDARALFDKPVVAVHPGVGNATRQWPAEHFAALIDLLVERNAVNVLLIGGAEEAELAGEVHGQITNGQAVVSLVGGTSLRQLFDILRACTLYIGNNSGPKHIAAMLGVPTIGVHSGVVDATEWAPVGRRAVAVRRDMACSPCYIESPDGCPRNMACLRGLEPAAVFQMSQVFLATPLPARIIEPLVETAVDSVKVAKPLHQQNGRIRVNGNGHAPPTEAAPTALGKIPRGHPAIDKGNAAARCNSRLRPV